MKAGLFPMMAVVWFQALCVYTNSMVKLLMLLYVYTMSTLRVAMIILSAKDELKHFGFQCLVFMEGFYSTDSAVCTLW